MPIYSLKFKETYDPRICANSKEDAEQEIRNFLGDLCIEGISIEVVDDAAEREKERLQAAQEWHEHYAEEAYPGAPFCGAVTI